MKSAKRTGIVRQKRSARMRRQILEAGLRVFATSGYDGASMDDIAEELEATKGLLYYYFRSKQELLAAILREHPLRAGIEAFEQGNRAGSLQEALSELAALSLQTMRENRAFVRFLLFQAQSSRQQAEVVFREVLDRWTAVCRSVIEQKLPRGSRRLAPLLAAQFVDLLLASFIRRELGGKGAEDLDEYGQEAVQTIVSRVTKRPAGSD